MRDGAAEFLVLIIGVVTLALVFWVGVWEGVKSGTKDVQTEAVKAGVARWVTDQEGHVSFEWKKDEVSE